MKVLKKFNIAEIDGNYLLVPYGASGEKLDGVVLMNDVGVFIWKLINEGKDTDDIVAAIVDEYDVAEQEAADDTGDFLKVLRDNAIIE